MGSILMTHGTRNCSAMSLTHPAAVLDVHMSYVLAGSSLLFTNTFQANSLSQRKIGMDEANEHGVCKHSEDGGSHGGGVCGTDH